MNVLRKKAGINIAGHLKDQGADAIRQALAADKAKKFSDDEIEEITQAILAGETIESGSGDPGPGDQGSDGKGPTPPPPGQDKGKNNPPAPKKAETQSINKFYEEWRVEPIMEDIENAEGEVVGKKLKGRHAKKAPFGTDDSFTKLKLIKVTSISPEHAELMNSHAQTSGIRYYLKK